MVAYICDLTSNPVNNTQTNLSVQNGIMGGTNASGGGGGGPSSPTTRRRNRQIRRGNNGLSTGGTQIRGNNTNIAPIANNNGSNDGDRSRNGPTMDPLGIEEGDNREERQHGGMWDKLHPW